MCRYRLETIETLARQMEFTPAGVRDRQLIAAEELLGAIEPLKAYPSQFIVFRITGYHPKTDAQALLAGMALQHDLGLLIEKVSETLCGKLARTDQRGEPVLAIEDLCRTFNVTSKTLQRWRRRGLAARRFVFPDGKRRVGFRLAVVERFLAEHGPSVRRSSNPSLIAADELSTICRHARRLATSGLCDAQEICRRISRRLQRSPLSIEATLRKHDAEQPALAIMPLAAPAMDAAQRERIAESIEAGEPIRSAAARAGLPGTAVYAIALGVRIQRLTGKRVKFFDDPLYHEPNAADALDAMLKQDELPVTPTAEESRTPGDLPAYLRSLFKYPLLGPARERALFLAYNFAKYGFVAACRRLDPATARARDLDALEELRRRSHDLRNRIAQANLRLVVSVASKHVRPGVSLMELISEGNIVLLRAIEGFDTHRGYRFSTYATLALMKGFARSVPQMQQAARKLQGDGRDLEAARCRSAMPWERAELRDEANQIFDRLTRAQRDAAQTRFDFAKLETL